METTTLRDEEIRHGLREHPQIRSRIAALLAAVNDAAECLKRADDAENRLIQGMRGLGQQAMQTWAQCQVHQSEQDMRHIFAMRFEVGNITLNRTLSPAKDGGAVIQLGCGPVAQSVEQRIENPCVGGSIPPQATIYFSLATPS